MIFNLEIKIIIIKNISYFIYNTINLRVCLFTVGLFYECTAKFSRQVDFHVIELLTVALGDFSENVNGLNAACVRLEWIM